MKVITHDDFHEVYTSDPAAEAGRIQAVLDALGDEFTYVEAEPASWEDIQAVHTERHIDSVIRRKLDRIASLAAGGAVQAAETGLSEPCFALVRPPGHHASADSSWGFCYFNNMAIAIEHLKRHNRIRKAHILDFDLHFGDGNVNILGGKDYVTLHNPDEHDRASYLRAVQGRLRETDADIVGVSAGFDNHARDWGGLLLTEDYQAMGLMIHELKKERNTGCFGVLEGGYNHNVLGVNVRAFLRGLQGLED